MMGCNKHLFVITTICLFGLNGLPSSRGQPAECSRAEYGRCVSLADPLLKEPHLVFPDNMADIELVCVTWNQFVDCLKRYTDRCFTAQQRRQFNKAVENPIESVHLMCTKREYQQEYLQHATCIKSTVVQPEHCGDQYTQLVDQVSQGEAISRASLCCSHDRFRRCVAREARRMCDRGEPNGPAVKFAEQIIDKALSFLQDQCYNYIPNSGDCISVSYKSSDDQLAMSTSPWLSTRGRVEDGFSANTYSSSSHSNAYPGVGSSTNPRQHGSYPGSNIATAADTGMSGVTIVDMSDPADRTSPSASPGGSQHLGHGNRPPAPGLLHSASGAGGNSNTPGGGSNIPGLQQVDTRVTDMAWMPSGGDMGSTRGTAGQGDKDMGSTVPGRGDGSGLGSRTRPSSYGRSSSWDTSPASSPSPTPPTRPDWATVSTWHVYSTGDRTQNTGNNFYGSPSTNTAGGQYPSASNPVLPSTTETWYPAAGSHVGNEVDEPNQLGLAKPKHSGAAPGGRHRAAAVELSLTMVATVLVAYC